MFIKGQSGNPLGRAKMPEEFKAHGPEAIARLLHWMQQSKYPKLSLQATQTWLAYWLGRPTELTSAENLVPILQNVINEQAVLKLIYARNFDERGVGTGNHSVVASGVTPLQAGADPA